MAFCPNCGKRTKKGFCIDCRPSEEIISKEILIKVCSLCKKIFKKNIWTESKGLEKDIISFAKDKIKDKNISINVFLPKFTHAPGVKVLFEIEVEKDQSLFKVPAEINLTYCDRCAKKQGQYFEGTLQLRRVNDEILDFIENYIKKTNISIANKIEKEEGYDLDISDQRKLQNLGHLLKKNFGGTLKISIRQFTQNRQTSKQIYRVNALYEAPDYKKGDALKVGKKLYLLTSIRKSISGIDLSNGKKASVNLMENDYTIMYPQKTTVSKIYPLIEVFDPDTYQSVPVENKKEVKLGEKVKIINDNGLFYIL